MKKWVSLILTLALGVMCLGCTGGEQPPESTAQVQTEPTEQLRVELNDEEKAAWRSYLRELASHYTAAEDGTTVTVTVPDFTALAQMLPEDADLATVSLWQELAAGNPELVKEYVFTLETADEAYVYAALYDAVVMELFLGAVSQMQLDFSDPAARGEAGE